MKTYLKYILIALPLVIGLIFLIPASRRYVNLQIRSYHTPVEDSLRAVIFARDLQINTLASDIASELDTIYITRTRYVKEEAKVAALPDSSQVKLFLTNYPDTTPADANTALLSPPIPIPSIRSANLTFVKLTASNDENGHLWSITDKQGQEVRLLQAKVSDYTTLAQDISLQRDSCALDNGALTETVIEQDMKIEKQKRVIIGETAALGAIVMVGIIKVLTIFF
jgi:hypothetical protein